MLLWEERLRRADQVEQEYNAWRRDQAVSISDSDRREILALGENLPRLWHAATTRSTDRKQIVRLVINEVTLDQKRRRGYVWIKVIWQTGAASEQWLQRCVQSYAQHADQDRLRRRVVELNGLQKMDGEIAVILNGEALRTAHGPPFDPLFAEAMGGYFPPSANQRPTGIAIDHQPDMLPIMEEVALGVIEITPFAHDLRHAATWGLRGLGDSHEV